MRKNTLTPKLANLLVFSCNAYCFYNSLSIHTAYGIQNKSGSSPSEVQLTR